MLKNIYHILVVNNANIVIFANCSCSLRQICRALAWQVEKTSKENKGRKLFALANISSYFIMPRALTKPQSKQQPSSCAEAVSGYHGHPRSSTPAGSGHIAPWF